ncbi:MAG: RluA family pseudouridine synthase [Clostridiales Family XIII bacterium]|jgi:23S rRNA pseudouridine1911/1915/1917 synthase|nr:RluA family pseudouridine synthase [Clostridiales Family XIII bacterium]
MTDLLYVEGARSETRELRFGEESAGRRLDAAIAARCPDLSRSRVQSLIDEGNVGFSTSAWSPGKNLPPPLKKNYRVQSGDIIIITVHERIPLDVTPEDIDIDIVYEDGDLVVADKPRGMAVHPSKGNERGTLVNALLYRCELSSINGVVRPGIVHRIDKNTSGLLVAAKNDRAHAALAAQLAAHTMTRRYAAIVYGGFSADEGTVDAPIGRDVKDRLRQAVRPDGRRAVTHWRVSERLGPYSLLELTLETGRTHQIRVHMAYIKHPLIGDDLYGPAKGDGQYLHARTLGFVHPTTAEYLSFESPLPLYFLEMLRKLRK